MHNFTIYCLNEKGYCVEKLSRSMKMRVCFPQDESKYFTFMNLKKVRKIVYNLYIKNG